MPHPPHRAAPPPVLVTGAAGFIGFHCARALLERGERVVGVDSLNDYYDPALKRARLDRLAGFEGFAFERLDLAEREQVRDLFRRRQPRRVLHLAAQAGVRWSVSHPQAYTRANLLGFANVIDACVEGAAEHLVFASSSSVYGDNDGRPLDPARDRCDHPLSLYAATKRSNELVAHATAHIHGLPVTGLRYFSVYGPWGRPDMALWLFTEAIAEGRPIRVFNRGEMHRDFTYVDDVVAGSLAALDRPPAPGEATPDDPSRSHAPFRIYNLGGGSTVKLTDFIDVIEAAMGRRAERELMPMQAGDVRSTFAGCEAARAELGFSPEVGLEEGVRRFVEWWRGYTGRG